MTYTSSIVGVPVFDAAGNVVPNSSLSIPEGAQEMIISNLSGSTIYLAYSISELDNDYSRIMIPDMATMTPLRMTIPKGVGQLFIEAEQPVGTASAKCGFWLC